MITLSEHWKGSRPDARVGLLYVSAAPNLSSHPKLAAACQELEENLRERYGGLDRNALRELPVYAAYDSFYRQFRKTYHVQLQLESVVHKGKPILSPSALVSCLFMAELQTGLLTAGHDYDVIDLPLIADVASGGESYQRLDGSEQQLKEGDLYIHDQQGILSSVIYGPDRRTRITNATSKVVYTTYGPPGIDLELIRDQLEILESYLKLFAPNLMREYLAVL